MIRLVAVNISECQPVSDIWQRTRVPESTNQLSTYKQLVIVTHFSQTATLFASLLHTSRMASKVFRKLQVFSKTPDFKAATKLVEIPLVEPSEKQLRIRNVYAGVNATDVNITSARYFTDGKVPFDIGLEVILLF